jgi:hypothetical protein
MMTSPRSSNSIIKGAFLLAVTIFAEFAPASGIDWSQDLCQQQKEFFTTQFLNRLSVDGLANDVATSNAKIVLIGETHFEADNRYYPTFLKKLNNAAREIDCVSFELNDHDKFPIDYGSDRWRLLAERAQSMGMKTFKIDRCVPALDIFHDFLCLDGRNAFMTQRLVALLKAKVCTKILHVSGSMHLQNSRIGGGPSFADRLNSAKISTYRIQLVDTAMEARSPGRSQFRNYDSWVWGRHDSSDKICAESPGLIRENFAFLNRGVALAARVPVFYNNDQTSQSQPWSDFDAALVLGCPDGEIDRCADLPAISGYLNAEANTGK